MPKAPKIDYLKCSQCRKDRQKCLPKRRRCPDRCERCEKYNYRCSENRTKKDEMEGIQHSYSNTALGGTSTDIGNYTNTVENTPNYLVGAGNSQTQTSISSSVVPHPPTTSLLPSRLPGAAWEENGSQVVSVFSDGLCTSGYVTNGGESTGGGNGDQMETTLSQRIEELSYLKWLWGWLEPMFQHLENLKTSLNYYGWGRLIQSSPGVARAYNFIKHFMSIYKTAIHNATLTVESDEKPESSLVETLGQHMLSCHAAFQPAREYQLSFLARRTTFYEMKGDFLNAQHSQERLLATLAEETHGKIDDRTDMAVEKLIELYKKSLDKLGPAALRLGLDVEMSLKVAPLLHQAVSQHNTSLVMAVLSKNFAPEPGESDILGRTAIHYAAHRHATANLRAIASVYEKPPGMDDVDHLGWTTLQAAAGEGHLEVVKLLIQYDAKINASPAENGGRTALQAAAERGHLEVVKLLIQHGAELNAEPAEDSGRTALQAAAGGGHPEVVKLLIQYGAEVNAEPAEHYGRTALQAAAGGHLGVVKLLIRHDAEVNAKPAENGGRTALQAAAEGGHPEVVKLLIQYGTEVNAEPAEHYGRTALQAAVGGGHLGVVKLLIKHGADVNAQLAEWGQTALQAAAGGGHLGVVKLLIKHGADVNAQLAEWGQTALQAAAEGGHLKVVKLLIQHGADVNAQPANWGRTALQAAAEGGHLEVVKLLIQHGADINAQPAKWGRTALQAAAEGGHLEVVKLLIQHGADVNAQPAKWGRTALQAAAGGGHLGVVKLLIRHGARA